jgi:soluble lytic murein transglycosylase-like protein
MGSGTNVLSEYLVKLSFLDDTVSYARFAAALRNTSSLVDNEFFRMGKKVLEFQAGAVGAFAAIGAAAIGIADKTAMADQEYRLLALHMYTSLPVARELKIAIDALGQPLENIMWDPELARRFNQLVKDQRALTEELGPDFENQMLKIRDVRFEWTRFGVELEYLTMNVVQDLARAFGTNIDDVLARMRKFNEWFIANMPAIAEWIATNLKPILIDVKDVMAATWELTKQFAVVFTNLIGLLSGDKSLSGTALSFDKIAKAIQYTITAVKNLVLALTQAEIVLSHLLIAASDVASGDFKGAKTELSAAGTILGNQARKKISGELGLPAAMGLGGSDLAKSIENTDVISYISKVAKQLGVPVDLALAVAQVESNYQQYDKSGKVLMSSTPGSHATGIFQLQPGTAKSLGVDPRSESQNIFGGVLYLKQLLAQYGNSRTALEHYYGSKDAGANAAYASKVTHVQAGIQIGTLNLHVPEGASKEGIKWAVIDAIREADKQRVQRNLAEFSNPGWSY